MLKAVIFDFDGTLVHSNHIKSEGFVALAQSDKEETAMRHVLEHVQGDRKEIIQAFLQHLSGQENVSHALLDSLLNQYTNQVDDAVIKARSIVGAEDLLTRLTHLGLSVFLSSATPYTSLKRIIEARQWTRYFDAIFGRPQTKLQTLRYIEGSRGFNKQDMAVVGDGLDDKQSAETFGCHFFAVGEREALARTNKIHSLNEVKQAILAADK